MKELLIAISIALVTLLWAGNTLYQPIPTQLRNESRISN